MTVTCHDAGDICVEPKCSYVSNSIAAPTPPFSCRATKSTFGCSERSDSTTRRSGLARTCIVDNDDVIDEGWYRRDHIGDLGLLLVCRTTTATDLSRYMADELHCQDTQVGVVEGRRLRSQSSRTVKNSSSSTTTLGSMVESTNDPHIEIGQHSLI